MKTGRQIISLFTCIMGSVAALAQMTLPDRVPAGTIKSYWVDSVAKRGFTYTWAINGTPHQRGARCLFIHQWQTEGTYTLTLQQETPGGCPGQVQSGEVHVLPSPVDVVRVFPNPLYGREVKFQVFIPKGSMVTVDLFASDGQLVSRIFKGYVNGSEVKTVAYSRPLSQGIYSYQVSTEDQVFTGRLIIITQY